MSALLTASVVAAGWVLGGIATSECRRMIARARGRRARRMLMEARAAQRRHERRIVELARAAVAEGQGKTHLTAPLREANL